MKPETGAHPQIPMHSDVPTGLVPASMSQGEFARHRGVSEPMVSRWKAKGFLVMTADARVDVAASQALLARVLDPARGGKRGASSAGAVAASSGPAAYRAPAAPPARGQAAATGHGDSDADKANYNLQAARERRAKAQLAELELAREAASLVPADVVRAEIVDLVRGARDQLMQIGRRVAPELVLMTDPRLIEERLLQEYRAVCASLAGEHTHDGAQAA